MKIILVCLMLTINAWSKWIEIEFDSTEHPRFSNAMIYSYLEKNILLAENERLNANENDSIINTSANAEGVGYVIIGSVYSQMIFANFMNIRIISNKYPVIEESKTYRIKGDSIDFVISDDIIKMIDSVDAKVSIYDNELNNADNDRVETPDEKYNRQNADSMLALIFGLLMLSGALVYMVSASVNK